MSGAAMCPEPESSSHFQPRPAKGNRNISLKDERADMAPWCGQFVMEIELASLPLNMCNVHVDIICTLGVQVRC